MESEQNHNSDTVENLYWNIIDYKGFNDILPHGFTHICVSTDVDGHQVVKITPGLNVSRREMVKQINNLRDNSQIRMTLQLCEKGCELRDKLYNRVDYVCPDDEAQSRVKFLLTLLIDCAARNPHKICKYGFHKPHAWYVDSEVIALEKQENVKIGDLISTINQALTQEFESRRGNKHQYTLDSTLCIATPNSCSEDSEWLYDMLCELTEI